MQPTANFCINDNNNDDDDDDDDDNYVNDKS